MGSHLFCRFLSRTTQHWCCAIALLLATSPTVNASIWINEFDYDAEGKIVGIEKDLGDDDFYGQSYFADPRGQFIGDVGSAYDEELLIRDLDLDKISEVRQTWQFFRDRRPDSYGALVAD